jgi:hypothetical protein
MNPFKRDQASVVATIDKNTTKKKFLSGSSFVSDETKYHVL